VIESEKVAVCDWWDQSGHRFDTLTFFLKDPEKNYGWLAEKQFKNRI
jgi:hypothetical protein